MTSVAASLTFESAVSDIFTRTRRASIPRPDDPESPALSRLCYESKGAPTEFTKNQSLR